MVAPDVVGEAGSDASGLEGPFSCLGLEEPLAAGDTRAKDVQVGTPGRMPEAVGMPASPYLKSCAHVPLLVKDTDGRTRLVRSTAQTVGELREEMERLCGVPKAEQMLSCTAFDLSGPQEDAALELTAYAMVYVRVRCLGGKGGFGAMLRGQASRPGMKKTESNTGAMRDLSGRRLRHVEQEAQLKDWVKDDGKRKQEKEAEKKEKRAKHYQEVHDTAAAYVAEAAVDGEEIASAVRQGIELEKQRKRDEDAAKERRAAEQVKSVKKLDKMFGESSEEDDSSEDDSDKKKAASKKKK